MRAIVAAMAVVMMAGALKPVDAEAADGGNRDVAYLSRALAEARAENDALKARLALRGGDDLAVALDVTEAASLALSRGVRVADANRELRMVVLDAGRRDGMVPGMVLSVMQGERVVARIRVCDVRGAISGAVVEDLVWRSFPVPGDRVLAAATTE